MEKRGKGRPKKLDKVIKILNYELTPRQLKQQTADVFLGFYSSTLEANVIKEYKRLVEEYPIEKFNGKGFGLFRKLLQDAKSTSKSKDKSKE